MTLADAAFALPGYERDPKSRMGIILAAAPKGRTPLSRLTTGQLFPRVRKSGPLQPGVFWAGLGRRGIER